MNIKKHIPNFLTCCNLLCGCLGIIHCFNDKGFPFGGYHFQNLVIAGWLIFLAGLFDFFDGFAARLLKVSSPIGKELDSLADCVTFGVLPGLILFKLIYHGLLPNLIDRGGWRDSSMIEYIAMIALIIPIFSALRLAKFNIDIRQSDSFIGVPTPTNAILVASFPLILSSDKFDFAHAIIGNPYFLIGYSIIMSYLLVAELPLLALKFKNFGWEDNKMRYILILSSIVLFTFLTWASIPVIIFLYIGLSVIENKVLKPKTL